MKKKRWKVIVTLRGSWKLTSYLIVKSLQNFSFFHFEPFTWLYSLWLVPEETLVKEAEVRAAKL